MGKLTICLDFDGVLHSYVTPWRGADQIPDDPVPGAMDFLWRAIDEYRVAIYSSRSTQPGGIEAMRKWTSYWLANHAVHIGELGWRDKLDQIVWADCKPQAHLTIDDRAVCFTGRFPTLEWIRQFRPWNHDKRHGDDELARLRAENERLRSLLGGEDYGPDVMGDPAAG